MRGWSIEAVCEVLYEGIQPWEFQLRMFTLLSRFHGTTTALSIRLGRNHSPFSSLRQRSCPRGQAYASILISPQVYILHALHWWLTSQL